MDYKTRRNATSAIWIAALLSAIVTQTPATSFNYTIFVALLTAFLSTVFIWWNVGLHWLFSRRNNRPSQHTTNDIDSRAYKLAILMEMMDEDERQDFKYQLKNNLLAGDESVSLESMVSEKRKRR